MIPLRSCDLAGAEQFDNRDNIPVSDRRGHRLPSTLEAITARNRLLVEAANHHFAGMSDRAAAVQLHTALARYAAGRWRRSRIAIDNPHQPDTLAASLWLILKVRDHTPSARSIRRVLADLASCS